MTIDDPDLEAMLRVIEQETGDPPATVLRRALARALAVRDDDPVPPRTAADMGSSTRGGTPSPVGGAPRPSPWALLAKMAGSVDMPPDWAEEHDHYLYGVPKRTPDT